MEHGQKISYSDWIVVSCFYGITAQRQFPRVPELGQHGNQTMVKVNRYFVSSTYIPP
jgi:hypothetical protein